MPFYKTIALNVKKHPDLCDVCRQPHPKEGPCEVGPSLRASELRAYVKHNIRFRDAKGEVRVGVFFDEYLGTLNIDGEQYERAEIEILGVGDVKLDVPFPWARQAPARTRR